MQEMPVGPRCQICGLSLEAGRPSPLVRSGEVFGTLCHVLRQITACGDGGLLFGSDLALVSGGGQGHCSRDQKGEKETMMWLHEKLWVWNF